MPATNVRWPVPLQRLTPWYPGQFGVPGTDSERGLRLNSTGTVFYVDPNAAGVSDQRDGTNPDEPLATVAAALTHCQPYRGDVIAVMDNSYWTFGNPAVGYATPIRESVTVSVPGVRIVGVADTSSLGVPWVPTDDDTACITVNAMDVLIEGFSFWEDAGYTGTVGIAAEWNGPPYGENLTVRHCNFYGLDYGITFDYTWYCHVEECRFVDIDTWAIHNPSVYGEPDYLVVRHCMFWNCEGGINLPDTDGCLISLNRFTGCTVALAMTSGDHNTIKENTILGDGTGTNNFINLTGGAGNFVMCNWMTCSVVQYDTTCSDATSGCWGDNRLTNGYTAAPPT